MMEQQDKQRLLDLTRKLEREYYPDMAGAKDDIIGKFINLVLETI